MTSVDRRTFLDAATPVDRRTFLTAAALAAAGCATSAPYTQANPMHGLIGRMKATPGSRAELAAILLDGTGGMPGCLSYVVAEDPEDPDALWITEVWTSAEAHRASLELPSVQEAIRRGRPLIAGFDSQQVTRPLGGVGLAG